MTHLPIRVIVAGGGVAGLEGCLALHALAGDRTRVTLIAPNRYFSYRPIPIRDPLAVSGRVLVPVSRLVVAAGAEVRPDRVVSIEPGAAPARAEPFDARNTAGSRVLMHRLREGQVQSLAFVEPAPPASAFDLYDLALETAVTVRRAQVARNLVLITAAPAPLAILGARAAAMLHSTLGAHGIRVVESSYVRSIGPGEIELAPQSRRIAADRVIALPRLGGPWLDHLPADRDGFLPADTHGRVTEADAVYAAGDCTSFPVKHPSLAAQQADAVAAAIAADAGLPVAAEPFKPVLRGLLPSRLRWYVDAPLTGGDGDATTISALPLWSSQLRFDARFLAPKLEREALQRDLASRELDFRKLETITR
jgi:sulfide:quinone oxidoreductase